jgi:hypothetical protein
MDTTAMNYNPSATMMGQCVYDTNTAVVGCMDTMAMNYNPSATMMGQCVYDTNTAFVGCMDTTAMNYNPNATMAGQCAYDTNVAIVGCMDTTALNYNPNATMVGQCNYPNVIVVNANIRGCMDQNATNFNSKATQDNGSCLYASNYSGDILGCMDNTALNFKPNASKSSNSCIYSQTNAYTPIVLPSNEVIASELLESDAVNACGLDFTKLIDSATVKSIEYTNDGVEVVFQVWQMGVPVSVTADFIFNNDLLSSNTNYILTTTIYCVSAASRPTENSGVKIRGLFKPSTITGLLEVEKVETLNVIPNPIQDNFSINYSGNLEGGAYEMFNSQGVKVISQSIDAFDGVINVNSADLQSGIYILKIKDSKGDVTSVRLIK